jgi:hypothetical protein
MFSNNSYYTFIGWLEGARPYIGTDDRAAHKTDIKKD